MSSAAVRLRFRSQLNPSQWRAWQSEARWTAFLGGWGAGKTWLGARVFLRNVCTNPPGVDSFLVGPYWDTVNRTTLREFLAVTPPKIITARSKKERFVEVLGRRVYYGSADTPETLDGPTVGAVWIDEGRYVSAEGWRVVLTRLRSSKAKRLCGIVTSTPGGAWLEKEFGEEKPGARHAVHASTRENRAHLGEGTIEDMETSLSERQAKVFLEGQFGLLEGAVYEFDRARHAIPWAYNPSLPVVAAWDFGWQRPAVVFLQPIPPNTILPAWNGLRRVSLPGSWVAFDELVPDEISTESLAFQVKAKGYRLHTLYCDPAGDATQPALGLSDVQALRTTLGLQPKFVTHPRLRHIPFGVRLLEAMLGNVRGETRLFVAKQLVERAATEKQSKARGVVKSLSGYRYPESKDGRPVKDEPLKDGLTDHVCDALRYFALNEAVRTGQVGDSAGPGSINVR